MGFVQSYITKKSVRKKNRIDKLFVSLFSFASLFSASFVIIIVVIVGLKGLNPFLLSYEGFNNVTGVVSLEPVNPIEFILANQWLEGPVGASSYYGIGYAIVNTIIAVILSMILTVPVAVLTALLIAKVAPKKLSNFFSINITFYIFC